MPKGKKVVLGLITAKYVPLENPCLSPQCGFASSEVGNQLTEDDQKRKLELAVQVAAEVRR